MSNEITKRLIRSYLQEAMPTMFFSGFFQSPDINFHTSEEVEVDIERQDEDVAIVIQDLSTGARYNADDFFTNKKFKPPVFKEAAAINAFDLIKRETGQNPFQDPNFQANAIARAYRVFRKLEKKIRRAVELMASQVIQTGTLTLTDNDGNPLYVLDFKPKATHFPTASVAWGTAGADPLKDLEQLGDVIRADGLVDPDTLIFDAESFDLFLSDEKVAARFDNRRYEMGRVTPQMRGQGATYQGSIMIGNYRYEMWTYSGRYKDQVTKVSTPYTQKGKVSMLSSTGTRLDLTFGAIPMIVAPEQRVLPYLPSRISDGGSGFDLTTNAWVTADGEQLHVSAGTRPLTIPTAIDTFGCLDTGIGA